MGFDGGGAIGGAGDFGGPIFTGFGNLDSGGDNINCRTICCAFILTVILFIIIGSAITILILALVYVGSTTTYSISPKEQILWCDQRGFTLELSSDMIKVFEANKSEVELSDEVRSFRLSRGGKINRNSYVYRSFFLPENSTVTVDKQESFSAWLIIFKGRSRMENYIDYGGDRYELKFFWTNDTYTFQPAEFSEYFVMMKADKAVHYSVVYSVTLTTYDTKNLTMKCESNSTCKLNSDKIEDHCWIFDYDVDDTFPDGEITIKIEGADSKAKNMIIILSSLIGVLILVLIGVCVMYCVILHKEKPPRREYKATPATITTPIKPAKAASPTPFDTSLTGLENDSIPLVSTPLRANDYIRITKDTDPPLCKL